MSAVTTIQTILNDTGTFWPEARVLDAINEAQLLIYLKTKHILTTASLSLSASDDIISIPTTITIPLWIQDSSQRYFPTTHRELETKSRLWREEVEAKPYWFVLWDSSHFRVFPKPDTSYTYTLYGLGLPTEITNSSQDLVGPGSYVGAVIDLAVALLLQSTRPDLAEIYYKQSQDGVMRFKRTLRNYQSHNIRRLRPGGYFDIKQSGKIGPNLPYHPWN